MMAALPLSITSLLRLKEKKTYIILRSRSTLLLRTSDVADERVGPRPSLEGDEELTSARDAPLTY